MEDKDIELVKSYLRLIFQPQNIFTSPFHKETDLNTRTYLHNEVSRIYNCHRNVIEDAVNKTNEAYKTKYGIYASNDPYSEFDEIYDMFTKLMETSNGNKD